MCYQNDKKGKIDKYTKAYVKYNQLPKVDLSTVLLVSSSWKRKIQSYTGLLSSLYKYLQNFGQIHFGVDFISV